MEPHSRFNLEEAVAAWRAELARLPGPAPADLRELEAHLREAFADLKEKELSDEEAFLIACRRFGPAQPVAAEFAKTTRPSVWRTRLFWLAFAYWGQFWWNPSVLAFISLLRGADHGHLSSQAWLYDSVYRVETGLIQFGPMLIAGFWLACGVPKIVASWLSTRQRVAAATITMTLLAYALVFMVAWRDLSLSTRPIDVFAFYIRPACLIALMIWLTPGQQQTAAKNKTAAA